MSPRLKVLSGRAVVLVLQRFGFTVVSTRGSHVKLRRLGPTGERQVLTVPHHAELAPGTARAIFRQASRFVSERELQPFFFIE